MPPRLVPLPFPRSVNASFAPGAMPLSLLHFSGNQANQTEITRHVSHRTAPSKQEILTLISAARDGSRHVRAVPIDVQSVGEQPVVSYLPVGVAAKIAFPASVRCHLRNEGDFGVVEVAAAHICTQNMPLAGHLKRPGHGTSRMTHRSQSRRSQ